MKKQLYLLACITMSINSLIAFDNKKMLNFKDSESQFMFLEKNFITDVYAEKNAILTHMKAFVPAACAAMAGYKYWMISSNEQKQEAVKQPIHSADIYLATAAISATILGTQMLQCYINSYVNRNIVKKFMHSWSTNRPYTPQEFHHVFDALNIIMEINGDDAVVDHATEIVEIMQFILMRHFGSRYQAALALVAVENLSNTKYILDIIKTSLDINKIIIG